MHEDRKAGERAERVLRWIGASRQDAAREIGVSLSLVAMMAGGSVRTRRVVALAIQAQFGVRAEYILSGKLPIFFRPPGTESLSDAALAVAYGYTRLHSAGQRRAFRSALQAMTALEESP
jgi:hypothetical protein